jgi:pantothenate kinase
MSLSSKAAVPTNIDDLITIILHRSAAQSRFVVAIAGPPGSGKSTLSDHLAKCLGRSAKVLPMDGFHLDNDRLQEMGLLHRKGAPETFNALGLVELMRKMRGNETLLYPTFDRKKDRTIPNSGRITQEDRIVLVEGNYLLLETAPWSELSQFFDLTVALDVCRDTLQSRLIERWINHGFSQTMALEKALSNDMVNVAYVQDNSCEADYRVKSN